MTGFPFGSVSWAQDTTALARQVHVSPTDSVVVESPLPGGVASVVRFLLTTVPSWLQIAGVILAGIGVALALWLIVRQRKRIRDWVVSRPRAVKIGLAVAAAVFLTAAAGFGAVTWNYTQHSNDFCTGCHVMDPAYDRMANGESEHSKLSCHDCHQQSIFASARQLYVWVQERPEEIGEHAKVPNRVCETCHVTQDTAQWQRIASTAGHRVHLESDSAVLNNVQCVTCHGVEVHAFRPVNATCGQSDCHKPEDSDIVLGKMAGQTVRHCTSCHEFTAAVPVLATTDSARGTLVPGANQCLGCHEMRAMLADFDARREPHGGKCGTCHNPHEQTTPRQAAETCGSVGCHSNWREEPFHSGLHRRAAANCLTCHQPHSATVDASDCRGCHEAVRARGRLQPPVPFDTTRALQRTETTRDREPLVGIAPWPAAPHAWAVRLVATGARELISHWRPLIARYTLTLPLLPQIRSGSGPPARGPESREFSHTRHARLACLVCHQTGEGHGRLTFERPRGCQICHHQAPAQSRCATCHERSEYAAPQPVTVTVAVPNHTPRPRPVGFLHEPHLSRTCLECHTTPVSLAPSPAKATCRDCHEQHHAVERTCATCHAPARPERAHDIEAAHQACTGCHTQTTIARLTPTRPFCSTCHTAKATGHYDNRECALCHFLAEPAALRSQLHTRRE